MATVIDALLVTLGLDAKQFQKGAADAAKAAENLKQKAVSGAQATEQATERGTTRARKLYTERKRAGEQQDKRDKQQDRDKKVRDQNDTKYFANTLKGLKSVASFAAVAVLGFEGVKGAINAYGSTVSNLTGLGRFAPTVGMDPHEVNLLGTMYKQQAVGDAKDAATDLATIAHAQFSYKMGQPDAFAGWANRQGIALFDAKTGRDRDKLDILKDVGANLRKHTSNTQDRAQYAAGMGLSSAAVQTFVMSTKKQISDTQRTAEAQNVVTQGLTDKTRQLSHEFGVLRTEVTKFGQRIVGATVAPVTQVMKAITGDYHGTLRQQMAFSAAERKYKLPHGLLSGIASTESSYNPNAVNKSSGARGLMGLMPNVFPGAGQDEGADIDTSARELARLLKVYKGNVPLALKAYNDGQGNVNRSLAGKHALPAETQAYPGKVMGAAAAANFASGAAAPPASKPPAAAGAPIASTGGPSTSVDIGSINIYTPATDGPGIAATIPAALRNKGVVAQANSGMS